MGQTTIAGTCEALSAYNQAGGEAQELAYQGGTGQHVGGDCALA